MSVKWTARIWEHADLKGSDLLMLLAVADHANDEGVCWPKVKTLATKARLSTRQAQRVLQRLEDDGYMIRDNIGGRGNATNYVLQEPERWPKKGDATMSPKKKPKGDTTTSPNTAKKGDIGDVERVTSSAQRVTSGAQKGDIASHTREEPSIEPSIEPSEEPCMSADADSTLTEWQEFMGGLCWVCHGHMKVNSLTESQKGQLTAEAKRISKLGYGREQLREWFVNIWQLDWRWKKNKQRPTPADVRSSIAAVEDHTPAGFEVQHRPRLTQGGEAGMRVLELLAEQGIQLDE